MAIPNFRAIVEQIQAQHNFPIQTLEGCGQLTRAAAVPIHKADPRFKMLKKKASRTHVVDAKGRLHGADVLLFVESPSRAIAIDIIGSSASPDAKVAWTPEREKVTKQLVYRYTAADGFAPDYEAEDRPTDRPTPEEPPESFDFGARITALEEKFAKLKAAL